MDVRMDEAEAGSAHEGRPHGVGRKGPRRRAKPLLVVALSLFAMGNASAQVQRTIINTGLEQPSVGTGCIRFIADIAVPGWITTEPNRGGLNTTTCQGAAIPGTSGVGRPLEIWGSGVQGVAPRAGTQFVELNAFINGRLRQDVCLVAGETVDWSASHRGRGSATVADVMEFRIGAIPIARMATASDGAPSSITPSLGTANAPAPANNGWVDYGGQFVYSGATGTVDLGFEAISSAVGNNSIGNFLDNIQINLRPFVEFEQAAYNQNETSPTGNRPRLVVAGTVPVGGMTVPVTITGGTATLGLDYTTASGTADISIVIPAGVYDNASFPLPITMVNDGPGDPDETITFSTPATAGNPASPYNLASLQSCGGVPIGATTSTISEAPDPLPRIQLSKALSANRLAVSDQFVLRITGINGAQTTTTGAGSVVANGTITVGPASVGTAYTLSEVMAAGSASALTAYTNSIACTNTTPNSPTVLPGGAGSSFSLTVAATDNISCTLTNDVAAAPAFIDVVKTVTSGQLYDSVGDIATYNYVVTNTGPTAVNTLTVTDNRIAAVNCGGVTTLAAGASVACTGAYTVTQADIDDVLVTNIVRASAVNGAGQLAIDTDDAVINRAFPAMTADKNSTTTNYTAVGQVIPYTYVVTNTGNTTLDALTVTDNRVATVTCPVTTLAVGASTTCTGSYTITQADIDAGSVSNFMSATAVPPAGTLAPITDTVTINATAATPALTLDKSSATTTYASVGQVVPYSYLVSNTGNVTINALTVSDDRIATVSCPVTTLAPAASTTCTASYTIVQADMDTGVVTNNASVTGTPARGTLAPAIDSVTVTSTAAPALTLDKTAVTGNPYAAVGDVVGYQYLVTNPSSVTINALSVSDDKITTVSCPVTTLAPAASTTCVGSYTIVQADLDAGSVTNNATVTGTPATGTLVPGTDSVTVTALSSVSYTKTASRAGPVVVGDLVTYTLSLSAAYAATTSVVTLTDTLGPGLDFVGVSSAGAFTCNATNPLVCALPAGTAPGTYTVTYQARVNATASGTVTNAVVGSGADNPVCSANCVIATPVAAPVITLTKSSNPGAGTEVQFGQAIEYTLTATVSNSATLGELALLDTPDRGLTIGALPNGCSMSGASIACPLPAGTPAGVYTFVYSATVNAQARATVSNQVAGTVSVGQQPICNACSITHQVMAPQLRVTKVAGVREARIGDLVRYTLTVENVGDIDLVNGDVVDTPAAGFGYVEGSMQAIDGDNQATAQGNRPLRFGALDVARGQTATLVYLMRVGAGVRAGMHQNQAQAFSSTTGDPISNVATAQVALVADPLLDDSLIVGTVFGDRDGDGWQDGAALSGVRVQGGFAPGAYIAGSTTVDRGNGPQPEPDASAPLLHGIAVGAIAARQSDADPVEQHQVIVSQRLRELAFTGDFVLTSAQGVSVRMDAAGNTSVESVGDAARGLNAAAPTVERRVAQGEGGHVVDYVIRNTGIDERGIPGVRIASVEGLLMETDQYGRYHLAAMPGGPAQRGRNFILKIDPATLPAGTGFTTDNPLLLRITPGLPARFDFGVKLPVQLIEGGSGQVELELGEVFFTPGSAEVRAQYLPVIEKMAAKLREYRGGEVVIDANGGTRALAYERAVAVKEALLARLDAASVQDLRISARGNVDDPASLLVGVEAGGTLLGTMLFDTGQASIRPEFLPLLDTIAAALEHKGGGSIAIVGHTDVRGSYDYNAALGLRRAKAVYEALAKRLSLATRAKVRVEVADPSPPEEAKHGGRGS